MVDTSIYLTNDLGKRFGMIGLNYATPAYPGLADQLTAIYRDKIQEIPGVPSDWFAQMSLYHNKNGWVLVPIPRPQAVQRPDFLADPNSATSKAWEAAALRVQHAVQTYGQQLAEAGRKELEDAYADTNFWHRLWHSLDKFPDIEYVPDVVKTIGSTMKTTAIIAGVAVVGALLVFAWRKGGK